MDAPKRQLLHNLPCLHCLQRLYLRPHQVLLDRSHSLEPATQKEIHYVDMHNEQCIVFHSRTIEINTIVIAHSRKYGQKVPVVHRALGWLTPRAALDQDITHRHHSYVKTRPPFHFAGRRRFSTHHSPFRAHTSLLGWKCASVAR